MIGASVGLLGVALAWGWLVGMRMTLLLRVRTLVWLGLWTLAVAFAMSSLVPHPMGRASSVIWFVGSSAAACFFHLLFVSLGTELRPKRASLRDG